MNIYNRFLELLPSRKTDVGTIVQVYSDGCRVELLSGGYTRVLGNGTVGQKVFIRQGEIVGEAPNLGTFSLVEV